MTALIIEWWHIGAGAALVLAIAGYLATDHHGRDREP